MEHVKTLQGNDWIERCKGPRGSSIVLAAKPHQEHIKNIDNLIWRMCVSYRKLNAITKSFKFSKYDVIILLQSSIQGHNLYGSLV